MFSKEVSKITRDSSVVLATIGFNEPFHKARPFGNLDDNMEMP